MKSRRLRLRGLIAAAALLGLAGCGSSPPVQYYTLGSDAGPSAAPQADSPSMVVGPVSLPPEADRQQLVRLVDGVRLEVAPEHRWAGPLKAEIARRLAGRLSRELGWPRVVAWPQGVYPEVTYSLPIGIQRLETVGFEQVSLEAVWSLRSGQRELAGGRFTATQPLLRADHAAIAEAHARLVDALAAEIATRLPRH